MAVRKLWLLLCLLAWLIPAHGQPGAITQNSLAPAQAQALVDRALATELRTAQDPNRPMRYLLRKSSPRLTTTKEIVETRDGAVARLLSINDKPLNPADEQNEQARLNLLAGNPNLQRHRKQGEDQDLGIVLKLLRMLPNAFLYHYESSSAGPAGPIQRFSFRPNPQFSPPDFESQALTAMTGELWIDASGERVMRLEGHLEQDTDYAWGILGKLNKGGWIVLEQQDVGQNQWRIVHFQMQISLRILFKTKDFDTVEQMTRYVPVPVGLDYRQAIEMLRASPGGGAQAGQ